MNTWLDLIIPIPFLIAGLIIYYRRKNMSYQELQDEIKQIQSLPDNESWTSVCYNIGGKHQTSVFADDD